MKKIKIGYVVASLNYGGVENYVVELANGIKTSYFEPIVFTLKKDGPLRKKLKSNTKVYELKKREGNDLIIPIILGKIFRREKINVVHSNNWSTYFEAIIAKFLGGRPKLLHTQHGIEMSEIGSESIHKRMFRNQVRGLLSHFTEKLVVVSNATKNFVCDEWGVKQNKVNLIYNGVDLDKFKTEENNQKIKTEFGIKVGDVTIGSVGRLAKIKNYEMLIDSFSVLIRKFKNLQLIFVGDGDQKNKLKKRVKKNQLDRYVKFLGQRKDVHKILNLIDIFVLPSFSEGLSIAVLEAMASSIPVILTNVGGNSEIIQKNRCGIIIESDEKRQLIDALNDLIINKSKRNKIGREGKKRVQKMFNQDDMIKKYEKLYFDAVFPGFDANRKHLP